MKLQLDTTNKTIKIEERINLKELFEVLSKLLPNNEWKEFDLETSTTIIGWHDPVVVPYPIPVNPAQNPWSQPWYYMAAYDGTKTGISPILKEGTYCIEFDNNSEPVY